MTDSTKPDTSPFGKRFAEAWSLLQAYLADLDTSELDQISRADFEGTLEILKRQPALGQSSALNPADRKDPESLALAIIQERLRVLNGQLAATPEGTFGGRFLHRWRQLGGPISVFNYAQIQKLKKADRDEVVQMFRGKAGGFLFGKTLKDGTPEEAAEVLLNRHRVDPVIIGMLLT